MTGSADNIPEELTDSPEPVRECFQSISAGEEVSFSDIREETGLTDRGVKDALDGLQEAGVVDSRWSLRDARKVIYFVPESGGMEEQ